MFAAPEESGVRPAEPDFVVGFGATWEPDFGKRHRLAGTGETQCVCEVFPNTSRIILSRFISFFSSSMLLSSSRCRDTRWCVRARQQRSRPCCLPCSLASRSCEYILWSEHRNKQHTHTHAEFSHPCWQHDSSSSSFSCFEPYFSIFRPLLDLLSLVLQPPHFSLLLIPHL